MTISSKITVFVSIWVAKHNPPLTIDAYDMCVDSNHTKNLGELISLMWIEFGVACRHILRPNGDVATGFLIVINSIPWQCLGDRSYELQNGDHFYIVRLDDISDCIMPSSLVPADTENPPHGRGEYAVFSD